MVVDGIERGEVRQYGNFSFARVYEAGHEIPYYQRKLLCLSQIKYCMNFVTDIIPKAEASLAYFNRTLFHWDIATGEEQVTANLTSSGGASATHTESYVSLTTFEVPGFPSPIYPATTAY